MMCFADKLGRVLKHMDKAMQLAQDVVGQVLAGLGLAMQVDRHILIFAPHLADKAAQAVDDGGRVFFQARTPHRRSTG